MASIYEKPRLEVHIGRDGAPSKTECVFFPPPQFFDNLHSPDLAITTGPDERWLLFEDIPPSPASTHTTNTAVQICSPRPTGKQNIKAKKETQESIRQKKIDVKYDALPETKQFDVEMATSLSAAPLSIWGRTSHTAFEMTLMLKRDLPWRIKVWVPLRRYGGIHILTHTANIFCFVQSQ